MCLIESSGGLKLRLRRSAHQIFTRHFLSHPTFIFKYKNGYVGLVGKMSVSTSSGSWYAFGWF